MELTMTDKAEQSLMQRAGNIVVGAFHESPVHGIIKVVGSSNRTMSVTFYAYSDESTREAPYSEAVDWTLRRDIKDFPESTDPLLPYVFDLHWDIKRLSDVKAIIAEDYCDPFSGDPIYNETLFKELVAEHNLGD
jgi:hypothetical protein